MLANKHGKEYLHKYTNMTKKLSKSKESPTPPHENLRAALSEVQKMRDAATALEKATIRVALAQSHHIPAFAAKLLGVPRQTMIDWLRRQHSDVGQEARQAREQEGYRGGNPHMYSYVGKGPT